MRAVSILLIGSLCASCTPRMAADVFDATAGSLGAMQAYDPMGASRAVASMPVEVYLPTRIPGAEPEFYLHGATFGEWIMFGSDTRVRIGDRIETLRLMVEQQSRKRATATRSPYCAGPRPEPRACPVIATTPRGRVVIRPVSHLYPTTLLFDVDETVITVSMGVLTAAAPRTRWGPAPLTTEQIVELVDAFEPIGSGDVMGMRIKTSQDPD